MSTIVSFFCVFGIVISYSSRSQSWPGQAWWFRWLALADCLFKPHFTPYQKKPVSFFNRLSSLCQNYDKNKLCPLGVYQAFLIFNFCLICLMKLQKEMSTIFSVYQPFLILIFLFDMFNDALKRNVNNCHLFLCVWNCNQLFV